MLAAVVSTLVAAGEVMVREGATLSLAVVQVTVKAFDAAAPLESTAVTVRTFAPG
jgi:hypothetical protein